MCEGEGGHLAVAAPSFSGWLWGGRTMYGTAGAQLGLLRRWAEPFISEVGHSFVGCEWVTDLPRVCRPFAVFSWNTTKNSGLAHASVLAECDAVLHRISTPVMFSRKGLLLQRFLNIGIAGVPQAECSLSRDEFALGHR